ncbi:bifunctional diaminohydroxyphosphoribosylaminopyrimidine deaminase/5-amino-6-(5-phosphoribosylamino)uracil reductase RibD [Variovorax sp. VNK109]|jgi:diaminohydroxyphosphoribosylaminopyrimidine deaminase/5-amino-6-(5-phosphoribosylamino)uracil reductase|uniref:bifunctional diaminohydroxyphosphoribosylaminopyrimidine deaminase/5-amino-6-(5-phosphoribosylamino)uracil reductase RibD n=1 Tax=Variovorax sp. VNK109 TaxID=3400919 RepID=UPI003C06E500
MNTSVWDDALALARQAIPLSSPNPRVGCVLADAGGQVIGRGFTQQPGGAHAEVMALRDAAARGLPTQGATAWVTLEPCSHHGRTPPCADALVAAGLAQVNVAMVDPNPQVSGRGLALLREAGLAVELLSPDHPVAVAAHDLNAGFISRMTRGQPWLRLKTAASLDGRTALNNGTSQWITGEAARADGHVWRARASGILTGVGTVLRDDPSLTVRSTSGGTSGETEIRQPDLVILDSHFKTPPGARIFRTARRVFVYGREDAMASEGADARCRSLQSAGATVIPLACSETWKNAGVDLHALVRDLARLEMNEVHVEAGATLNGALLREALIDEFLVYLAPVLLGEGAAIAGLGPLETLAQASRLRFTDIQPVGNDLRLRLRPATDTQSLRK